MAEGTKAKELRNMELVSGTLNHGPPAAAWQAHAAGRDSASHVVHCVAQPAEPGGLGDEKGLERDKRVETQVLRRRARAQAHVFFSWQQTAGIHTHTQTHTHTHLTT